MKNTKTETRLDELLNIGKAVSYHLQLTGINHPKMLIGKEPFELYQVLCARSGKNQNPCVIDVFMSVIYFNVLPGTNITVEGTGID